MKAKVSFAVFAILAAFVILTLSGCATYGAKGVMPSMSDPSVDKLKLSTTMGNGIVVTAYPLTTKAETKKYFDEDFTTFLGKKEIVAIFLKIQNGTTGSVKTIAATLNMDDNNNSMLVQAMTAQDVYGVLKRDWLARASGWFFVSWLWTAGLGGPISALDTYLTNNRIREDIETTKMLNFAGEIKQKGTSEGFVCFRVPEPLREKPLKKSLKVIFQNNDGRLFEYNLDIKG